MIRWPNVRDRVRPVAWWLVAALVAVALGLLAQAPGPPGGVAGRALPRVPAPTPDLGSLLFMLGVGSPMWFAAAVAAPVLAVAARRLDPERVGWSRTILIALAALVALTVATTVLQHAVIYRGSAVRPPFASYLLVMGPPLLVPWAALIGLVGLVEARRRAARSSLERERLRAELAEQRLVTLTAQLQPHFLFNTLQGISTLIHRDPAAADELLSKLGDLLREVLRQRERPVVSLGEELGFARTYLEIVRLRFADRLQFAVDAPASLEGCSVPLFILQPLIENAVTHGIGGTLAGGRIEVRATAAGDLLRLEVEDDGAGMTGSIRDGLGLGNTRARLRASYGAAGRVELANRPGGGTVARLEIPRQVPIEGGR